MIKSIFLVIFASSFLLANGEFKTTFNFNSQSLFPGFKSNVNAFSVLTPKNSYADQPLSRYTLFLQRQISPTEGVKFNKNFLTEINGASTHLKKSFYLKYASNGASILQYLILVGTQGEANTSYFNLLSISSNFLDAGSMVEAGRIYNLLSSMSKNTQGNNSYLLLKTARRIKKYKNYGVISSTLGFMAQSTFLYTLVSFDEAPDEDKALTKGFALVTGFAIGSLVTKFLSLNNLEKAGQDIKTTAKFFSDSLQKQYWNRFGDQLIKASQNWKKGFWYKVVSAITRIPISTFSKEMQIMATIANTLSIVEYIIGEIYQNWIPPYNLLQAGESLEDLKEIRKRQ
ncbi:hypothetical protein ACX8XN_06600 [Calditrichota bacterium GD2]